METTGRWPEWVQRLAANPYAQAAAIVLVAFVAARLVNVIVTRLLRRLTERTRTELDDRILAALDRPVSKSVLLVGLGLAARRIAPPPAALFLVLGTLKTLAVLLWAGFGFHVAGAVLEIVSRQHADAPLLARRMLPLYENLAKLLLAGAAVYFLFLSWNIDVTAWLASAGIVGLALGFAAKDTLANLFSGLFILADAPYKLGDYIVLDSGERGRVTQVGLRSTRLLTRDDVEITIPNAVIANAKIVNESGGPWKKARLRVPVGVAYGSDVDRVRRILLDVAGETPVVAPDPAPRVRFQRFGDSSLDFELQCWIRDPEDRGLALDALNTAIYKRFAAEGVEIPFPQRDLHIKEMPGSRG
ncbi:MAG: mechanosensitive ion channel family protein [Acidobacteria bacterium]|nr:MAG: mechanosensitive ion channel family protein [Acidobacteriota bacterium]